MQPAEIQKLYHTHGDSWEGLTIGPVTFDGAQPLSALADCRLYFRKRRTGEIGHKLKTTPAAGEGAVHRQRGNLADHRPAAGSAAPSFILSACATPEQAMTKQVVIQDSEVTIEHLTVEVIKGNDRQAASAKTDSKVDSSLEGYLP